MERGVPIEVIPAHAIQDEQHDHSRSGKPGPQNRQYTACRGRGHLHAKRSRKSWRDVLLRGRHRVHPRFHCRARKHQRNRDVIRPGRTVHVRHVRVRPSDEVAFTRNDEELASSSGKVCPSEHVEEALSRRRRRLGRRHTSVRGPPPPEDRLTCWPETGQAIATRVRAKRTAPQTVNLEASRR